MKIFLSILLSAAYSIKGLSQPFFPPLSPSTQNYPNPFNPTTTIEFTLPDDGKVVLKIYDVLGREVQTLVNEKMKAGEYHQAVFNGADLASGIYFARLQLEGKQLIRKMMLVR